MEAVNAIQQTEQADPELQRKREKDNADYHAGLRRRLGKNPLEAERQEELLRDARHYALGRLAQAVSDLQLPHHAPEAEMEAACDQIRDRLVSQAWDYARNQHKNRADLQLESRDFEGAIWTEGLPSLQERALAAVQAAIRRRDVDESTRTQVGTTADSSGGEPAALTPSLGDNAEFPTGALQALGNKAKGGRGRPQTILDEKKAAAVAVKASGGSNKDAAAKIYGVIYPNQQQVRNVPAILRNYQAKLEKADSRGREHPKPSRKPNKNKG